MAKTILIADDDATIMKLFHLDLESRDVDVKIRSCATGNEAISAIDESLPDVVVLDLRMPQGDGFSVLEHLEKGNQHIPVIILTNYKNEDYLTKSKKYSNVKEYLVKHEVRMERVLQTVGTYLN